MMRLEAVELESGLDFILDCPNLAGAVAAADNKVRGKTANPGDIKQDDVVGQSLAGGFNCFLGNLYPFQGGPPLSGGTPELYHRHDPDRDGLIQYLFPSS